MTKPIINLEELLEEAKDRILYLFVTKQALMWS